MSGGALSSISCYFSKVLLTLSIRRDGSQQGSKWDSIAACCRTGSSAVVTAAREAKLARLRQAKEEAEKEIAEFRAQIEGEFQRKVAESSGDSGANVKRLDHETESKIEQLKIEGSRISHDVVQMLLKHMMTVKN